MRRAPTGQHTCSLPPCRQQWSGWLANTCAGQGGGGALESEGGYLGGAVGWGGLRQQGRGERRVHRQCGQVERGWGSDFCNCLVQPLSVCTLSLFLTLSPLCVSSSHPLWCWWLPSLLLPSPPLPLLHSLHRPVVVNIGRAGMATDNVTQRVIMVKENEKPHRWECAHLCFCLVFFWGGIKPSDVRVQGVRCRHACISLNLSVCLPACLSLCARVTPYSCAPASHAHTQAVYGAVHDP